MNEQDDASAESTSCAAGTQRLQQLAVLGELAVGAAHEARNLLTAIIGFAQIARRRTHDPAYVAKQLDRIERESLACVELLQRFLAPSHTDMIRTESIRVADVVETVADSARAQIEMQRLTLETDVDRGLHVQCSRDELTQVLLNLVSNALHASSAGGVITISATRASDGIAIAVTDTGIGIPVELHQRIFEPFFTTKPLGRGTGLGLPLSRAMLASVRGTLRVESTLGNGATFLVTLPEAP
jgi:signal transduction histidine kinase